MAKGLRSKSARKFRAIKREQVFKSVEDARTLRLSIAQAAKGATKLIMKTTEQNQDNNIGPIEEDSNMEDVGNIIKTTSSASSLDYRRRNKKSAKKNKKKGDKLLVHFRRK